MIHTLVKENTTLTTDVPGTLLISAEDGAALKGIHISGDLILAPGVKGNVTLTDTSVSGSIRNYGTGQVVFAESTARSRKNLPSPAFSPRRSIPPALHWTVPLHTAARRSLFTGTGL